MPTPSLARTERFELQSTHTKRSYAISLFRPLASPLTRISPADCPIVLLLDGSMTFGTAVECTELRTAVGMLAPAVIVGVAYDSDIITATRLRTRDLTLSAAADMCPELAPLIGTDYGGADAFLQFLEGELIPAVQQRAPEASATKRVIFGHSLAGLLVVHALLEQPTAFTTYLASSPSLWWNDFAVLRNRDAFQSRLAHIQCPISVLLTVASGEQDPPKQAIPGMNLTAAQDRVREARMIDTTRELAEWLNSQNLRRVEFTCFDGEDHGSVVAASLSRGLTFALRPGAPI